MSHIHTQAVRPPLENTEADGFELASCSGISARSILLVPHTGRESNVSAASQAAEQLRDAGINVRISVDGALEDAEQVLAAHPVLSQFARFGHDVRAADGVEMVLVLGGDGTFLRAADLAYAADLPVLGINLGHVGFLAEWDSDSLALAIERVIARDYDVEDRMTIEAVVRDGSNKVVGRGWALNEVSVESTNSRGVLDAILEVDGRPVSSFGCDGVLVSTPTGSTAYAFSAGGPVLWPELDAILVVPNNAHALFAKPLVVSPDSQVAVESLSTTFPAQAVMDGFRPMPMPPGSRIEIRKGRQPVRWVRLDHKPFADRLVTKFRLPVEGWRGPHAANNPARHSGAS